MPAMTDPAFADLALQHTLRGLEVPPFVRALAGDDEPELVWRNDLDGLTFRIGARYLKWNPRSTGIDLERERVRLDWISARHPAPRVVDSGDRGRRAVAAHGGPPGRLGRRRRLAGPPTGGDPARSPRACGRSMRSRIDDFPAGWATRGLGRATSRLRSGPDRPSTRRSSSTATPAPRTRSSPTPAPGPATSTSATWASAIGGPTSRSPRSASTGTSARATNTSSSTPTASTPDEDRIRYYRALWELES